MRRVIVVKINYYRTLRRIRKQNKFPKKTITLPVMYQGVFKYAKQCRKQFSLAISSPALPYPCIYYYSRNDSGLNSRQAAAMCLKLIDRVLFIPFDWYEMKRIRRTTMKLDIESRQYLQDDQENRSPRPTRDKLMQLMEKHDLIPLPIIRHCKTTDTTKPCDDSARSGPSASESRLPTTDHTQKTSNRVSGPSHSPRATGSPRRHGCQNSATIASDSAIGRNTRAGEIGYDYACSLRMSRSVKERGVTLSSDVRYRYLLAVVFGKSRSITTYGDGNVTSGDRSSTNVHFIRTKSQNLRFQ
ncbi:unnamed protein product [Trichogramma brassicae]|uniref:Uncharacterized protein n=1 Tax=Trichogramma brassicae TaxID=86971 RepID=A0A6H5HY85_9HYME|nr:unnamed protein product [Trichogramma brassicae]